jgi:hypothetical protein
LLQTLLERYNSILSFRIIRGQSHEDPDTPLRLALLRAHRERPCRRRAGNYFDEFAPSHNHTNPKAK